MTDKQPKPLTYEEMLEIAEQREQENREKENPDEIVLEDIKMFHLENMTPEHLWLSVHCEDGRIFHLNIFAKDNKLQYYWRDETCDK